MRWQDTSVSSGFVISGAVAAVFAAIFWRRRFTPGALSLAVMMAGLGFWLITYGVSTLNTDLPVRLFWMQVMYPGVFAMVIGFFVFALEHAGRSEWVTRRTIFLLAIVPSLALFFLWANGWHGLFWQHASLDAKGFQIQRGIWAWVAAGYVYLLTFLALLLLSHTFLRAPKLYRRQAGAVWLAGALMLVMGVLNTVNVSGLFPNSVLSIAPFGIVVVGLAFFFGVFGFRLADIMPVARATVIEGIDDGVIVLDAQQRIVDLNPAAQRILDLTASEGIGQLAADAFRQWDDLIGMLSDATIKRRELTIGAGDARRNYDVHASPLFDRRGQPLGQVIILTEVTELKRAQAQLVQQRQALAVLEERERLAREMHDSVGQVLGYVSVQAQAVQQLLRGGDVPTASSQLARLDQVARDGYADVRDYILSVRAVAPERSFVSALGEFLQRFGENYGITTALNVSKPAALAFPPGVASQVLRIVQEALNNVRKHARAHTVQVRIAVDGSLAHISIQDDGCGFDPAQMTAQTGQHFGSRIMRERAEGVGGTLQVESAPGQGTRVILHVPLQPEGSLPNA